MHYRVPYMEIGGGWRTEAAFNRASLEDRLKNLQAGGYASDMTDAALASWPAEGPVGFV